MADLLQKETNYSVQRINMCTPPKLTVCYDLLL